MIDAEKIRFIFFREFDKDRVYTVAEIYKEVEKYHGYTIQSDSDKKTFRRKIWSVINVEKKKGTIEHVGREKWRMAPPNEKIDTFELKEDTKQAFIEKTGPAKIEIDSHSKTILLHFETKEDMRSFISRMI